MKKEYWVINEQLSCDPNTREIANEFLQNLKLKGKAKATIDKYRWILEKFLTSCKVPLKEITPDDVLSWLVSCGNLKPRSIRLYIAAVSSFFQYCEQEEYLDCELIKKHWRPKTPQTLPRYLTSDEVSRLKMAAEEGPTRDRAIVEFLLSSGCRRCELSRLNVDDLDLFSRMASIMGKGGRPRKILWLQNRIYHDNRRTDYYISQDS